MNLRNAFVSAALVALLVCLQAISANPQSQWKNYVKAPGLTLAVSNQDPAPIPEIVCDASFYWTLTPQFQKRYYFSYTLPDVKPSVNRLCYRWKILKSGLPFKTSDTMVVYSPETFPRQYFIDVEFTDPAINQITPVEYVFQVEIEANSSGVWHLDACAFQVQMISDCILGDLDGSGICESTDALLLAAWLAGNNVYFACPAGTWADLNVDGSVDPVDLVILLQHLAGNIQSLPF